MGHPTNAFQTIFIVRSAGAADHFVGVPPNSEQISHVSKIGTNKQMRKVRWDVLSLAMLRVSVSLCLADGTW